MARREIQSHRDAGRFQRARARSGLITARGTKKVIRELRSVAQEEKGSV